MLEFYDFIKSRRSIRQYRPQLISQDQLIRIIEAGKWAPSAHNSQPWRFFIIQGAADKERLANAMAEAFHQDLKKDGVESAVIDKLVKSSVERFSSAPVLLLVCLTMEPMDFYSDETRQQAEYVMAVQSVAAAIHTILLAAHAEGLGACWFCAPLFCTDTVQRTLGLAEDLIPQALITMGVANELPKPPLRHSFDKFATFIEGQGR